ncbi:MAG: ribonuclease HI [Syntrophales bacterium]
MGKSKKYYAIARGIRPGIYTAWFGAEGAEAQIRGVAGALYRGFASLTEARQWLENPVPAKTSSGKAKGGLPAPASSTHEPGTITVYTDGGCRGNPGPGGYGAIIIDGERRIELSEGFRLTTNNRMELTSCIAALRALKISSTVILYSDSSYVVNGIRKGWARKWRANNWMRTKSEAAENSDLWGQLLELCDRHRVEFVWVRGHAGQPENERCDELATEAAQGPDLHEDHAYVRGRTRTTAGPSQGGN